MNRFTILVGLAATTALGCSGRTDATEGDVQAAQAASTRDDGAEHARLTVMTQNVYLGADIDPILAAPTPGDVPVAVADAWAVLQNNRFEERAGAIADAIARARPDVVALQEVALFRRFPSDGTAPEAIDFLEILQRAFAARGLDYRAAAVQTDSDVEVPMFAGFDAEGAPLLDGVEMIDRDVVLVRSDVTFSRPETGRYAASLPVSLGGETLEIVRGWASIVVHGRSRSFRFMTTHLEDHVPEIQAAQADELLGITAAEPLPLVLAGDFNSPADGSQTATYATLAASGLRDVWRAAHPDKPGYTCCRAADLSVVAAPLTQRLDIVFARGRASRDVPEASAFLVGNTPRDRTPSGLWPSDHAGVVATFRDPTTW